MKNFFPLLRSDRLREMIAYDKRGYVFRLGKDKFNYVRNILVANIKEDEMDKRNEVCYFFEVRTNQKEPRFYITKINKKQKESCIYLTIYEIYLLFLKLSQILSIETVTKILNSDCDKLWYIYYTGLEFELKYFNQSIPEGSIRIPESNIEITYENLFILLALIQDKSNYYWSISSKENEKLYTNGILRLLICLLNTKSNSILDSHKWQYNELISKHELLTDDYKYKYYLTQDEYDNIMEV
jgi:hypothetical protein